ncbi:MAG TPA: NAD(P)H-dependent oxidoreductase, partial [Sphingomicrobium sp.]|nr:NAD(P)H-dependent oxidoreductase [Sphingomicrobium sp.]
MTILHIDSSINGDNSVSRILTRSIVDQLRAANPRAAIISRDLASEPLPHLTLDAFADSSSLDEFLAAGSVVIG